MMSVGKSGVYAQHEGIAVAPKVPAWGKKLKPESKNPKETTEILEHEGFVIAYCTRRRRAAGDEYREHTIDVFGYKKGFEAFSKEAVFQKMTNWLDSKTTNNGGVA